VSRDDEAPAYRLASYAAGDWPPGALLAAKAAADLRISVVLPARDEAVTVGGIVARVREDLVERVPLVDELVVIDSDSDDGTGDRARDAGAKVHRTSEILPGLVTARGKGEAIWKSQFVTTGDVVAFLDADLTDWGTHFVSGVLGPLLTDRRVQLVKGFYERLSSGSAGAGLEGGRVTELVARPLLARRWPELGAVVQPLAGEWAIRRAALRRLSVPVGYGVDLAALIDVHLAHGSGSIAQVDLGRRGHHHQSLRDLGPMALELLAVTDRRAGIGPAVDTASLRQFTGVGAAPVRREVSLVERPPAETLDRHPHPAFPPQEES
jgi:glucosyl-3-phosphoglycerate synthase